MFSFVRTTSRTVWAGCDSQEDTTLDESTDWPLAGAPSSGGGQGPVGRSSSRQATTGEPILDKAKVLMRQHRRYIRQRQVIIEQTRVEWRVRERPVSGLGARLCGAVRLVGRLGSLEVASSSPGAGSFLPRPLICQRSRSLAGCLR